MVQGAIPNTAKRAKSSDKATRSDMKIACIGMYGVVEIQGGRLRLTKSIVWRSVLSRSGYYDNSLLG